MIEETATVVGVEGEFAWVETRRKTACGSCAANKGCGTSVLSQVLGQKRSRLRVMNTAGARVGDEVVIGIQEQALVRGSLAVYLMPLLALLGGAMAGEALGQRLLWESPEAAGVAFGLAGLAGGFWWLRYFTRRIACDERYQAVVLRREGTRVFWATDIGNERRDGND